VLSELNIFLIITTTTSIAIIQQHWDNGVTGLTRGCILQNIFCCILSSA